MSRPDARGPAALPAETFATRPVVLPVVEDPELVSLWELALSEEFYRYAEAARRIVEKGSAAFPFLLARLDQRRRSSTGVPVALAQALIGRILAGMAHGELPGMLGHASPVVRYEAARALGERARPEHAAALQGAIRDEDARVQAAAQAALAACTAGK